MSKEPDIGSRALRPAAEAEFGREFYAGVDPALDGRFFAPLWHVVSLGHLVSTDLDRIARRHGLSSADLLLIGSLRIARRRLRPTDLAARLHVSKAALSARIARLVALGLIDRAPCDDDRRAFALAPTEAGARRADAAIAEISEQGHFARSYLKLSEDDRAAIDRALGRLHDLIDREFLPPGADR